MQLIALGLHHHATTYGNEASWTALDARSL